MGGDGNEVQVKFGEDDKWLWFAISKWDLVKEDGELDEEKAGRLMKKAARNLGWDPTGHIYRFDNIERDFHYFKQRK